MLSKDEIAGGKLFLLKLWNRDGVASQWAQTLCGDIALRWYDIYRFSNWPRLCAEALGVFKTPVTQQEAAAILKKGKCLYVHTSEVAVEDLHR